jgi:hypothetical protein
MLQGGQKVCSVCIEALIEPNDYQSMIQSVVDFFERNRHPKGKALLQFRPYRPGSSVGRAAD